MMVSTLVIYDIPEDKVRNRVSEVCKDYGLDRIQWSAFFGPTDRNRREEMMLKFRKAVGGNQGNIQMYVICDKDLRFKRELRVKAAGAKPAESETRTSQGDAAVSSHLDAR